jgi:gamma-glutamylcysteine synthetase
VVFKLNLAINYRRFSILIENLFNLAPSLEASFLGGSLAFDAVSKDKMVSSDESDTVITVFSK